MAESMYEASKRKEEKRILNETKRFRELVVTYSNNNIYDHRTIRQKKLISLAFAGLDLNYEKHVSVVQYSILCSI